MSEKIYRLFLSILFIGFTPLYAGVSVLDTDALKKQAFKVCRENPDSAIYFANLIDDIADKELNILAKIDACIIRGWSLYLKGESEESFLEYYDALTFFENEPRLKINETRSYIFALRSLGAVCEKYEAFDLALKYYYSGLESVSIEDWQTRAFLIYSLSYCNYKLGNFALAKDETLELIQILQGRDELNSSMKGLFVSSFHRLGQIYFKDGDVESSLEFYEKALNLFPDEDDLGVKRRMSEAFHNLGYIQFQQGKLDKALLKLEKAIAFIVEENLSESLNFSNYLDLMEIHMMKGHYVEAQEYAGILFELYDQVELSPENYKLFSLLSDLYYKTGQYDLAHEMSQRYAAENSKFLEHKEEILRIKNEYQFEELTASFFQIPAENADLLSYWLAWLSGILSLMLFGGMFREYYIRRSLQQSLREIQDSFRV